MLIYPVNFPFMSKKFLIWHLKSLYLPFALPYDNPIGVLHQYVSKGDKLLKNILEHYNLLIAMTVLTSLAILLKCICAISYQMLSKEAEQMSRL